MAIEGIPELPDPQQQAEIILWHDRHLIDTSTHEGAKGHHRKEYIKGYDPAYPIARLLADFKIADQYQEPFDPWIASGRNKLSIEELEKRGHLPPVGALEEARRRGQVAKVGATIATGVLVSCLIVGPSIWRTNHPEPATESVSYDDRVAAAALAVERLDALDMLHVCGAELEAEAAYDTYRQTHSAPVGSARSLVDAASLQEAARLIEISAAGYEITCLPELPSDQQPSYKVNVNGISVTVYASDIVPNFDAADVCRERAQEAFAPTAEPGADRAHAQFMQEQREKLIKQADLDCI